MRINVALEPGRFPPASVVTHFMRSVLALFVSIYIFAAPSTVLAANAYGVIELVEGKVSIFDDKGQSRIAHVNDKLMEGETIVTGRDGELHVKTEDHGFMAYRPNSKVVVLSYRAEGDKDDGMVLSIVYGALRSVTGWIGKHNPNNYAIRTPIATVGIRGTDHESLHIPMPTAGEKPISEPGTYEKVYSGRTSLKNDSGETIVNPGQVAFASHDPKRPPKTIKQAPEAYRATTNESKFEARKDELAKELEQHRAEKQKTTADKIEAEKKAVAAKKTRNTPATKSDLHR